MNAPRGEERAAAAELAAALEHSLARGGARKRGAGRLDLSARPGGNGLAQLVLALVKLLHELLERQALSRIEAGSLTEEEIERLGLTLMRQSEEIERIAAQFGLEPEDLNLDLGPLGTLF